jgi:hypothetical protein
MINEVPRNSIYSLQRNRPRRSSPNRLRSLINIEEDFEFVERFRKRRQEISNISKCGRVFFKS